MNPMNRVNRVNRARARAVAVLGAALWIASTGAPRAEEPERRRGFSIQITTPKNHEIVLGKTRIAATVRVDRTEVVDRVEFLAGEKVIFVDREAPYECFHDFGEEPKSWVIRAVAYHKEGVSVSDAVVTRKIELSYVEEVSRIVLWASVTDKEDHFVTGLTQEDFRVFEDGREQEILEFHPEDRPVTLAILIDTSGSMREQMKEVHAAAGAFVDTLRPEDKALVIEFDDKVFLTQDLTSDHTALKEAITSTEALGSTAIYDALHAAHRKLPGVPGRKAIVLLSDGDDSSSQFGFERVLEEAKARNVLIYSIGLGGGGFLGGVRRNVLKEFSEATGGRAFFVKQAAELAEVYQEIAEELRRQYVITYSTPNRVWDGRFIPVRVDCRREKHEVRARPGYFAVRPSTIEGVPRPPSSGAEG